MQAMLECLACGKEVQHGHRTIGAPRLLTPAVVIVDPRRSFEDRLIVV